ncbi:MAG TPA: trehalose-6-phosphate synthase [Ktedonobacteraceae bacterium]|nr:trehalose-6-phosphate synthase [Ktedonobacteraceae bacterium]
MPAQVSSPASPQTSRHQIHAKNVIIATNRGPVEYYLNKDRTLKYRRGAGGVVTALIEALHSTDAVWVALAKTEGDREVAKQAGDKRFQSPLPGKNLELHYVNVPKSVYHNHYDVISNQLLWFLQHYLLDATSGLPPVERLLSTWNHGYVRANQAIADAICAEIEREQSSSTALLLHDYHLYLVPAMIRTRVRSCQPVVMQQFIHIPWPELRYWQSHLPTDITSAIFNGLLGNDIIGFQTRRDALNFLEGAVALFEDANISIDKGTISRQGHTSVVRDYPISISVSEERRLVQSQAGKRAAHHIQPLLGEQTIMRVDRIEPTKNIIVGFQAYEHLLKQHRELQGKVNFLAFLVPSRESLRVYQDYKAEILKLVDDINRQFGRKDWTPIHAFVENDRTQALAALQFYDVLLVNPIIDGMNLVAKEGPVVNSRDGVLVLSRTSGAFQQLGDASIPVSPADTPETVEALYKALTLPSEERRRLSTLARQQVERDDLNSWIEQQVRDINAVIRQR